MAMRQRLAIKGGLVLFPTLKGEAAEIVIDGYEIADILPAGSPLPANAKIVDATDRAIVPGLINSHLHGHGTLAKGLVGDRWPLELFLNALPGLGANRTIEDKYLNGLLGAVEMIRKGSTACFDLFFEYPKPSREGLFAIGQAYSDAGIRAVLAPMVADRTFYQAYPDLIETMPEPLKAQALELQMAPYEVSAEAAARAFREWPFDRERVKPGIAPTIPLHCSDSFLMRCRDISREFDIPLQTHLAESKIQALTGLKRYGKTLTAHLDGLGLLGPSFSAAHAIWLDDDDMHRLADAGSSAIHSPSSNMRFGSGLADIARMLDHGINVGLATDAANSSDSLNMFEAARLGSFISRVRTHELDRWLGVEDVHRMATTGSAKAMGFDTKIGKIERGYKADLVFLDLTHINYVPLGNLATQMTFGENGAAVDSVMIDGRMVLDRGKITTLDEAKLRRDANAAAERLFCANAVNRELARRLQPVVRQFCRSLSCQSYHVQGLACSSSTTHQ
jgi:5-methylthioadenosine/S-adenosylhomocysteine deaminase